MSSVVVKMKQYLDEKGISMAEFERMCGLANGTFQKAFSKNTSVKSDLIETFLSKFPELDSSYLFGSPTPNHENTQNIYEFMKEMIRQKEAKIIEQSIEIGKLHERIKNLEETHNQKVG